MPGFAEVLLAPVSRGLPASERRLVRRSIKDRHPDLRIFPGTRVFH
jgi:hypothetical protein